MRNQALADHMARNGWVPSTAPARNVKTPADIERKGDWCFHTMEHWGKVQEVIVVRCPLCSADGIFARRSFTRWQKFLDQIYNVTPHKGTLACPQNIKHQFALKNTTWKIKTT